MGTPQLIMMKIDEGYKTIRGSYDGMWQWRGDILENHYNTKEKVEKLINMGNFRWLGTTLDYGNGESKKCNSLFYLRDCPNDSQCEHDWENDEPINTKTIKEAIKKLSSWSDYVYVYENDTWHILENGGLREDLEEGRFCLENNNENDPLIPECKEMEKSLCAGDLFPLKKYMEFHKKLSDKF